MRRSRRSVGRVKRRRAAPRRRSRSRRRSSVGPTRIGNRF